MIAPVPYAAQAEQHSRAREAEARLSSRLSTARLTSFLVGLAIGVWALGRHDVQNVDFVPPALAALVFSALVYWHARVEARIAWHDAHITFNRRRLATIAREWNQLPQADAPAGIDLSDHPYALDLDLFGHASLAQWLGPRATPRGRSLLATWLLRPASGAEIVERQGAIAELTSSDAWRADVAAHGILVEEAGTSAGSSRAAVELIELERFLAWAEGEDPLGARATLLHVTVIVLTVAIVIQLPNPLFGLPALWPIPMTIGMILSFAYALRVTKILDCAGGGQQALSRYAALFAHAVTLAPTAPRLSSLLERLRVEGLPASTRMVQLNRILGLGELRRSAGIFHFFIQALTLWDFHVLFALERWRRKNGRCVRDWLEALGELDALSVMATAQRDHPDWAVPTMVTTPEINAEGLGHPLLPRDRRVNNDATVGPPGTVLLITGSNMSGKSTLLRSIGLNVVLAQAGGCVCARRMELPPIDLQTSIHVQDSLERGLSYFMAALARLKGVVDAAEQQRTDRTLLYLLDEILQGTNSAERSIAVRAVARHLLEAGAIGAMTTHDLAIAGEEPLKTAAVCVHFSETIDEKGAMRFDYTLKPGLATSRNALRLMQMIGIDL